MAKDNKKRSYLFYVAIPVALILYLSLLIIDRWAVPQPMNVHLTNKIKGFNEKEGINNIIIGGSNVFYSISAEFLSNEMKDSWYNLSISAEGFRDQNYLDLLKEDLEHQKRLNVKKIIYSSIYYYRNGEMDLRNNSISSIDGSKKYSIKPRFSGLTYLQRFLLTGKVIIDYPLQNDSGDIIFTPDLCKDESIFQRFEIEDFNKIYTNILYKVENLNEIFPNAKIFIVFPKDYIEKDSLDDYEEQISKLRSYFKSKHMTGNKNELFSGDRILFQTPYKYIELCDSPSHANSIGRDIRSKELLNWLNIYRNKHID